jgi:hypothetical protein
MARYIDADALLKSMQRRYDEICDTYGYHDLYASGYDDAVDAVENAPTADVVPRTEWISVKERLPDCEYGSETEALLFRLKTGTVQAGYFGTGGRFRDKYFRCYHHANEGWDAKDVTHWMPLPEPPKGAVS